MHKKAKSSTKYFKAHQMPKNVKGSMKIMKNTIQIMHLRNNDYFFLLFDTTSLDDYICRYFYEISKSEI